MEFYADGMTEQCRIQRQLVTPTFTSSPVIELGPTMLEKAAVLTAIPAQRSQ